VVTAGSDSPSELPPAQPAEQPPELPPESAPPPATAAREAPVPDVVVLAKGHLHPAILLLRLLDALRQAAFPIAFGILLRSPWLLGAGIVLFLLQLGYTLARYLTLEYTLTADELRVREGLLERQERRIPLDRIQDLGSESSLLRRALGLTVVLVETASGQGVEARLDALSRADAEHLREVLLAARAAATARNAATTATDSAGSATNAAGEPIARPAATPPAPPEPEWVVHRATGAELVLRGITDLRLSAFVVTGFAALQLADQLGLAARLAGVGKSVRDWVMQFPPLGMLALLLAFLLFVITIGVVTSTLGNLVTFHGFALTLRGDVLQRRFGLLTTRQKTLPRERIQRVTVEQTWLRRLLGLGVVKADSAGGSRADGQDTTGGWDVVVPLTRLPRATALLPALLPGLEQATFSWQRGSSRLVVRTALQGVLLAAIAVPVLWLNSGPVGLLALLLVPLWALLGILVWRNLGFALGADFLLLQHGIIGRTVAYVPSAKVQAVVVRQGPVGQLLGLADLTVHVAGGSPTRLPDLTLADARRLGQAIAERAAIAAAAAW
jgi:putative membrane protein